MPTQPRRRRTSEDVRAAALIAARDLLLAEGPQGVTLKAVGDALGMTHANLIHHFGSAGRLQTALMAAMVQDLSGALDGVVAQLRTGELPMVGLLNRVFDLYQQSGGGRLAAWLSLVNVAEELEPIAESLRGMVQALMAQAGRDEPSDGPIGQAVLLASLLAVADSLAGGRIEEMLGFQPGAGRQVAATAIAGLIWGPMAGAGDTRP